MYLANSYGRAFVIVPDDTAKLTQVCRGIYVGGVGNVRVRLVNDTVAITFTAPPIGTILPIAPALVLATGTTVGAGLLIGLGE